MPICRRSATDVRGVVSAIATVCAMATPAFGQTAAGTEVGAIQAHGNAAANHIRDALATQLPKSSARAPSNPPSPDPVMQRRAFEAMRKRSTQPAMEARARTALDAGRAAFAHTREAMAKRLGQALGLDSPDMAELAKGAAPAQTTAWVPVLFVSSSMPISTLRAYAGQLEKTKGVMAFRGMPGGLTKVAPMVKLSAEILRLDTGCEGPACAMRGVQLIVDPVIFRQHAIARVPALAMIPGDPTQPYCERDDDSPRAGHIVFGDSALFGLLEEYGRLGGKEEVRDAQARLDLR
jgi:hypothetical protein